MVGFPVGIEAILAGVELQTGEHQEIRLVHVGMVSHQIVVGQTQNAVTLGFVGFLDFLGGQTSVGNGGVGMEIGLEITVNDGKQCHNADILSNFSMVCVKYSGRGAKTRTGRPSRG